MPAVNILHVAINNKIATYNRRDGEIVCNNPEGYAIQFTFDNEWAGVENKIARFVWNGEYFDEEIKGDTCPVPDLHGTDSLMVGVFVEGGLRTTTDAVIPCRLSILCKSQTPHKDTGKGYTTQAQEAAQEAESAADRAEDAATRAEAASDALNTPGNLYATDDGQGNVTLRGEAMEMVDSEARAGVAELREKIEQTGQTGNQGGTVEIPTFDLVTLGLPVIDIEGEAVTLETDTTEIRAALEAGAVRFRVKVEYRGLVFDCSYTMHDIGGGGMCSYAFDALGGMPMMLNLTFEEDSISANCTLLATDNGEGGATATAEIPAFDLATLGLPSVPLDGTQVGAQMDTAEIMAALDKGPVKFGVRFLFGASAVAAEVVMNKISVDAAGVYICACAFDLEGVPMVFNLYIQDGGVMAYYTILAKAELPATSIDLSGLDSEGKIVETFADGSTKTTTLEFDGSGNPVKITDGDGNVTVLTW